VTGRHRLSDAAIDQLAAGLGDARVVHDLLAAQLSRRKLMLHALRDLAGAKTSPAGAGRPRPAAADLVHTHVGLLTEAWRRNPPAAEAALLLPHTGAWLGSTLRRLRGRRMPGPRPLEAELSYLGMLAAVAAAGAGMEFKVDVVPIDGGVFLPDLGRVPVDSPQATLRGAAGRIEVGSVTIQPGAGAAAGASTAAGAGAGWQPLRRLHSEVDGLPLTVRLDDLDPFRDCHDLSAADRLPATEAARWQRLLDDAWSVLVRHHRAYADALAAGLVTVVPLHSERPNVGMNVTSMDAFGAVALTPPPDGHALALGLLHEFQHAKLGALLNVVPLYHHDDRPRFYAPWRDDPRPLGAALQGVYAFVGVTDFWRCQRRVLTGARAHLAEAEFVRWRDRVWRTFLELESSGGFTPVGERFLAGLRDTQERWREERVAADAVALAEEAAEDHWIGWRLRNRQPDASVVATIAAAWASGSPCPALEVPHTIRTDAGRLLSRSSRQDLVRLRINDPARFQALCAQPDQLSAVLPEAAPGDLALARGDHAAAEQSYRSQILRRDGGLAAWIGLVLTCQRRHGPDHPLPRSAELCLAVHHHLAPEAPVDPLALARWLAGG
jgi:HEXXH motif-containing protein